MSGTVRFRIVYGFLAVIALVSVAAYVSLTRGSRPAFVAAASAAIAPPSAADFGATFTGAANAYAKAHGERRRLVKPDCVEAAPGRYMCSYAVARAGRRLECHLIQARWDPSRLASYDVTLSGRAARCGTLRDAIRSLD